MVGTEPTSLKRDVNVNKSDLMFIYLRDDVISVE